MGSKTTKAIRKILKDFSFDNSENPGLPFDKRAARELYASKCSDKLMFKHKDAFYTFLTDIAVKVRRSKKKKRRYPGMEVEEYGDKKVYSYPAPNLMGPVVQEYWQLAVLYSNKYYELCEKLVGGIIDVPIDSGQQSDISGKRLWWDYNLEVMDLDSTVIWVNQSKFRTLCEYIADTFQGHLQVTIEKVRNREKIEFNKDINVMKNYIGKCHRIMTVSTQIPPTVLSLIHI